MSDDANALLKGMLGIQGGKDDIAKSVDKKTDG
jgi:hypothetical protein